jgi:hypothetical protein
MSSEVWPELPLKTAAGIKRIQSISAMPALITDLLKDAPETFPIIATSIIFLSGYYHPE